MKQGDPGDGHVGWRVLIRVDESQRPPRPWSVAAWGGPVQLGRQGSWAGGVCGLCPFSALMGCLHDLGIPRLGVRALLQTCQHLPVAAWGEAAMFRTNYSVLCRGIKVRSLAVTGISSRHL